MSCIVCRESQMKRISSVTPDYRRIFPIPVASDMNISCRRFLGKKLANHGWNQSETDDYEKIEKSLPEYIHQFNKVKKSQLLGSPNV
jgi:hypothetical protein